MRPFQGFQYNFLYLALSVAGNFHDFFFFPFCLIDVAMNSKDLRTILKSITHNGKQLLLTVLMMLIVVYLYTVIAFNFFRSDYVMEEDGAEPEIKCRDMLTVSDLSYFLLTRKLWTGFCHAVLCLPFLCRSSKWWWNRRCYQRT